MAEIKGKKTVRSDLTVDGNVTFQAGADYRYLELNDVRAPGSSGGGFEANTWRPRGFNIETHNDFSPRVVLDEIAAEFDVGEGIYYIEASCPAAAVGKHQTRLADITEVSGAAAPTIILGTSDNAFYLQQTRSMVEGKFEVSKLSTLQIQHRAEVSQPGFGFGEDGGFYLTNNKFSSLRMWQLHDASFYGPSNVIVPFTKQTKSLLHDTFIGELGELSLSDPLGFTSVCTVACWAKYTEDTNINGGNDYIAAWRGFAFQDTFDISTQPNSNQNIRVIFRDASQSTRQFQIWNGVLEGAAVGAPWKHFVVTWDGKAGGLKLYIDGVLTPPTTITTDLDDTGITDQNRDIRIGGFNIGAGSRWNGPIYSVAIYDKVLSATEINAMYNGGNAVDFNLQVNNNGYLSANRLLYYYRLGLDGDDPGNNYGINSDIHNLNDGTYDSDDLIDDVPM